MPIRLNTAMTVNELPPKMMVRAIPVTPARNNHGAVIRVSVCTARNSMPSVP